MILVVVNATTKRIEALPLKSATSETTVDALRVILARFSLPRTVVTDNGTQFTSELFRDFMDRNQIQHLTTAPYRPQTNGLAERAVCTVKEGLKKTRQAKLQTRLARFLCIYRRTSLKEGKSPAELLLGYQIRTKIDCNTPNQQTRNAEHQDKTPQNWKQGQRVWTRSWTRSKWIPAVVREQQGA